ncbi:TDP-4-oxo-6-deoxy-alpha-D-glucose-3, 4-oxoisomerase [Vibrio ruber DSM 16370]|uniref:TDP-4-oxo-6-deoxy-alpha-D-glucose-3, 4-oxoisomerase n=1 Tax=Vibrio ruber (strain DSM 16370 / JCM 11486 / BCRC 17186 / CECT 7878 / LMG 23124 / VR1) TaxID=1123498 RepID=A0A1R4LL37_VIBR1|nr:FdtA/QdtA family cupin domain-containing protein [Vibrio ruber]SJN57290.1 TDP-4-oxo-6-deoxy-alpha-D-glucose-3, 4-oxoisomerase [Vibrio ruber DSM 16370]
MKRSNKGYEVLNFLPMGDDRGYLIAIEGMNHIPFNIERVFYVYGTMSDKSRGCHANKNTRFVLVSISGSCSVTVHNGASSEDIILDSKTKGLYLDRMIWKEMHSFSSDSILMVMCSEKYDKDEYINNFDEYMRVVNRDDR